MTGYSRSARDTLRLPGRTEGPAPAPWAVFDPDWYRSRHADVPGGPAEETLEWYLAKGQALGHSPNIWFDEAWQRAAWPGILDLIEAGAVVSAFDAWCRGPHANRAPHWLFEPREYRTGNPALTEEVLERTGFINRYHHYLQFGAAEGRVGHVLFDPVVYLAGLDAKEAEQAAPMPFLHYLRGLETGAPERRTSIWFDVEWYRDRYKEAADAVRRGQYRSLLEHYLRNDRPTEFNPSPWFSEEWYLANNPGIAKALGADGFRNGFVHFRSYGLAEGRSPHPDLDLAWYADRESVRADIASVRAPDPFTHWIAIGHPAGLPGRPAPEINFTDAQAAALSLRRAAAIVPLLGRRRLDFASRGSPAISAIMPVADDPADTLASLTALRTQYQGAIEMILVGSDREQSIEAHTTGVTYLRFDVALTSAAARDAGLICATADAVLLLGPNVELAPWAIDNALARLTGDPAIGAVGGRLIQSTGTLLEAGGIVWRDGTLTPYARGAAASCAEANFVRDTDFCSTAFLLARRDVLTALSGRGEDLSGTTHAAADLCARIWRAGFRIVYEPSAVAFTASLAEDRRPDGRARFIAAHADFLATRPDPNEGVVSARSPDRAATRVLLIEDSIPLRRIGSGFVRSNDVLRALAAGGAAVTVFPMRESPFPLSIVRAELPDTVEVMHEASETDLSAFLAARPDYYDLIWVARTHNLDRAREAWPPGWNVAEADADWRGEALTTPGALAETMNVVTLAGEAIAPVGRPSGGSGETLARRAAPRPRIVVDTEAVASVREAERAASLGQEFDLDAALREEFRHLRPCMDVVAVTEAEAALLRPHHRGKVAVLGHAIAASPTPRPFSERNGLLFVGAIHDAAHPNHDGLIWFIDEVLPRIEERLLWETRLTVAGYVAPCVSLDRFKGHPRVTLRGSATELAPLYDAHRVFVAPARFAAGIPYKVHEAAAFGLPVVATTLLAKQLGWSDGGPVSAADASDPAGFAERVVALYRDAALWARHREAALAHVGSELDQGDFTRRLAGLLRPG